MSRTLNYPQLVLFGALAFSLSMVAPNDAFAGIGSWRAARAVKLRETQVQNIERQLSNKYGADAWYVFQVVWVRPDVTRSLTRFTNGAWVRDLTHFTITAKLETNAFLVEGSTAAAQLIWQGNHSPVRYVYHVFKEERKAASFYNSIKY